MCNWPEFRGPTGQGISSATNLPLTWCTNKNVAWKTPINGRGWSSPVLLDGRLFLTTAVNKVGSESQALRAKCLDAATGKTLWTTDVFTRFGMSSAHRKNSLASPTPVVEDGRLYVHFGHLGTACLDFNGNVLWRNTSFDYPSKHGNGSSPVLVDNALIFNCDGRADPFVVALDKTTGQVLWKTPRATTARRKYSFSTPLAYVSNGQKRIISPGSGVAMVLNPATGDELWRVRYDEGFSVVPRPVFGHGLHFLCSGDDSPPSILAVRAGGQGDVTESRVAWRTERSAPVTPSLLLVGDELYSVTDGGIARCVDARTGEEHWQERVGAGASASPVYGDGKIYFQDEQGTATVIRPGKQFQKLAENRLGERTLASYCVTDGTLFIRTEQNLYCIREPAQETPLAAND